MSIYQKRWSSCGSGTTPTIKPSTSSLLSSGVEPSTVGTSWNSVRWNKPSTSYRASLASRFEKKPDVSTIYTPQRSSTSRYSLSSAAKNAADMASIGPSVSSRASRFDSLSMPNKEKYRSEARELINKWSSRERTSVGGNNTTNSNSSYRSSYEPMSRNTLTTTNSTYSTPSYRTSTSLTPTRTGLTGATGGATTASRYSVDRKSVLSPSPTPSILHTTPKAERPWRQRMAESSRIRATLGDDYRSRQSSNDMPSVLLSSYRKSIPISTTTTTTRSKSPIVQDEPPIVKEEVTRKKSVRERTARRASRQNSIQQEKSSSEDDEHEKTPKDIKRIRSRSNSAQRLRKLRKKSEVLDGVQYKVSVADIEKEKEKEVNNKSMQSSLYETGAEDGSIVPVPMGIQVAESEGFQSCAASPLVPSISRSSSKNGVVKNQVIKSPSLIEVLGVSKEESRDDVAVVVLTDLESVDLEPSECSRIDDESQYSAVVHFKPKKRVAPVPGMWKSMSENEEIISRNKTIHRPHEVEEIELVWKIMRTIEKIEQNLKAVEKKTKKKKVIVKRKKSATGANEEPKVVTKKSVSISKPTAKKEPEIAAKKEPEAVIKKVEEPKKPLPLVTKEITKYFTPKNKQTSLRTDIKKVAKNHEKITSKPMKTPENRSVKIAEHYRRRSRNERATVLVDTPIDGKNHEKIRMDVKVVVRPMETSYCESECESRVSETRASVILDEMRNREADVEWIQEKEDDDDQLVLPDQSILEQYVNRKRRRLRPSSICSSRGYESSTCPSPCPSTVSELCLPSSVIVHEPRRRAPNSAEPSVQLNSTPKGFCRNPPIAAVKPVSFEAPKTLFEKMIQEQANRNRKSLNIESDTETRDPSPQQHRRGSSQDEGMSISSQFAAAAAAGNSAHGQIRYAAHIPLNRNDSTTSGRVSTTSIDSTQSGALDVASKNIDQVIDQARHRHHQHRNKFKEAIDYLDQIFEDLKKECDVDEKNNNNNTNNIKKEAPKSSRNIAAVKKETKTPPPTVVAPIAPAKKIVKPLAVRAVKPVPVKAAAQKLTQHTQSPVEVVIPVRKLSATEEVENQEPNIAETIVLKKTDKMDFTRRWLHDDLASLAHFPPANIAPNISYYQDFDEHSLGSCSAEVAAFNTTTKDRKGSRKKSTTADSMDPVRPRPFRPQPIYPINNNNNTLPRVTSTDEMRRSGSQDRYSTLRSMRSEGENSSPSAFQSFNRAGSIRSSLRSLADHSPVRSRRPRQQPDPIESIDQLVAELELNVTSVEKRRSFPTSSAVRNDYERPRFRQQQHVVEPTRVVKPNHRFLEKQHSAFETINQEKINPSRVEAMHNMFEEKGTSSTAWRKMSETQYATLNNNNNSRYQPAVEYTPQVPTSQPPQRPPGSANSSQGGYYSSNSSGVGSNYPPINNTRRSLVIDQQSISSRVPSVDEDDDGFYDNIGIYDDRRYSRGSELEASSSFRLPPSTSSNNNNSTKHRIGSFLRKIGNTNRPPGSAASLLSLNKLSNETVMKPAGGLMKSNSLSTEPWKKQVMREHQQPKGLGARLKNSIFGGSRKRLDA